MPDGAAEWALFRVGAVLGLLLLGLLLLERRLRARAARGGGATRRLTPQHALHVVEIAGRTLLVGTGPDGPPSLLADLSGAPVRPPAPERRPGVGWDDP